MHNPDGSLDMSKMTPEVLDAIERIDAQNITSHNEVGDVESTREYAHKDGFLHRNVTADENGRHIHSDNGKLFNSYADGENAKQNIPEKSHYERFDQFSKIEQHSFIPFTVTFDRIWSSTKKLCLNTIMGANGKYKNNQTAKSIELDKMKTTANSKGQAPEQNNSAKTKPAAKFWSRFTGKSKS